MCTLSLVAASCGSELRVVMNRDERRTRMIAEPPRYVPLDAPGIGQPADGRRHPTTGARALWPRDLERGGTWIAVTDAGLVFALLSVGAARTGGTSVSRGLVIPRIAHTKSIEEVDACWSSLDTAGMAPFRLVAASRSSVWSAVWNDHNARLPATRVAITGGDAHLFTSSSLGDHLVVDSRRALFTDLLASEADPWQAQDRLHRHAWPDRRHLSVLMSRADACTVSRTEVRVANDLALMRYAPIIDGWQAPSHTKALSIDGRRQMAA
jgi:hypothetical protein